MIRILHIICVLGLLTAVSFAAQEPTEAKKASGQESSQTKKSPGSECEDDAGFVRIAFNEFVRDLKTHVMEGGVEKDFSKLRTFVEDLGDAWKKMRPMDARAVDMIVGGVQIADLTAQTVDEVSKKAADGFYAIRVKQVEAQNRYALDTKLVAIWKEQHARLLPGREIPDIKVPKPPGGICLGGTQNYKENRNLNQEIEELKRKAAESKKDSKPRNP
jgi:hypothetical protein